MNLKIRISNFKSLAAAALLPFLATAAFGGAPGEDLFSAGVQAYRDGEFGEAARAFRQDAERQPSAGAFQNLGNAEWQRGRTGPAVLAWEQALWLQPAATAARNNLRYARSSAQLEAPALAWHEIASTWLPAWAWAWLSAVSLWLVAAMLLLPGILRRRRADWHQAVAVTGLTVFLLTLPAQFGLFTRSRIGFVLLPGVALRLTPTQEAQEITRLGAGEPARCERVRGNYFYIRLNQAAGWVERTEFGLICPR